MATTGIFLPNDVMEIADEAKRKWYTSRGKAIARIILEWKECQEQKPLQQPDKPQPLAA